MYRNTLASFFSFSCRLNHAIVPGRSLASMSATRNQEVNLNKKEEETQQPQQSQQQQQQPETEPKKPQPQRKLAPETHSKLHELIKNREQQPLTFAKMFRHSKFVGLGDQKYSVFYGKIVEVVGDDIYIDYGGKFNLICKKPQQKAE